MTVRWSSTLAWRHQAEAPDMDAWSGLVIREIENYIKWLITKATVFKAQLKYNSEYGRLLGSGFEICLTDAVGTRHYLLFEIEQYASGTELESKAKTWSQRYFQQLNTTTIIISLELQKLHSRLATEFSKDDEITKMVTSPNFKIFAASGDGRVTDEIGAFITYWIEGKL